MTLLPHWVSLLPPRSRCRWTGRVSTPTQADAGHPGLPSLPTRCQRGPVSPEERERGRDGGRALAAVGGVADWTLIFFNPSNSLPGSSLFAQETQRELPTHEGRAAGWAPWVSPGQGTVGRFQQRLEPMPSPPGKTLPGPLWVYQSGVIRGTEPMGYRAINRRGYSL